MTVETSSQAEAAPEPDESNRRGRIQYTDDVETGLRRGRSQRRHSADSMSARGTSLSRRFSIDPATVIPIEYRTLYVEKGVDSNFLMIAPAPSISRRARRRKSNRRVKANWALKPVSMLPNYVNSH
jgi:hypothetical protein